MNEYDFNSRKNAFTYCIENCPKYYNQFMRERHQKEQGPQPAVPIPEPKLVFRFSFKIII
jgi:hypothetical protein